MTLTEFAQSYIEQQHKIHSRIKPPPPKVIPAAQRLAEVTAKIEVAERLDGMERYAFDESQHPRDVIGRFTTGRSHTTALPARGKTTIRHAASALSQMGHTLGAPRHDIRSGVTSYEVTHNDGSKHTLTAQQVADVIHGGKAKPSIPLAARGADLPRGSDTVNLPANRSMLKISHAAAALQEMGHMLGAPSHDLKSGVTSYRVDSKDGKAHTLTAQQVSDLVYKSKVTDHGTAQLKVRERFFRLVSEAIERYSNRSLFDESEHQRADDGKFASSNNSTSAKPAKSNRSKPKSNSTQPPLFEMSGNQQSLFEQPKVVASTGRDKVTAPKPREPDTVTVPGTTIQAGMREHGLDKARKALEGQLTLALAKLFDKHEPTAPAPQKPKLRDGKDHERDARAAQDWLDEQWHAAVKIPRFAALDRRSANAITAYMDEHPDDEDEGLRTQEEDEADAELIAHLRKSGVEIPDFVRRHFAHRQFQRSQQKPQEATEPEFSLKPPPAKTGPVAKSQQPLFAGFEPETKAEAKARAKKKPLEGQKELFALVRSEMERYSTQADQRFDAFNARNWLWEHEPRATAANPHLQAMSAQSDLAVERYRRGGHTDRPSEQIDFERAMVLSLEKSGERIPVCVRRYLAGQLTPVQRFSRACSAAIERYAAERWITIGAHPGENGKKHGGTPVRLDSRGRITAGPSHMHGKTVKKLVAESKPTNRTETAIHAHAKKHRIARAELSAAVDQVHDLHRDTAREREAIRQRAGQMTGLNAARAAQRENTGTDSSRVEGFDESIQDIMDEFPGALGNDPNEHESRLWDIIRAGAQPVKPAYHPDILAEATQIVQEQRRSRARDSMARQMTEALGDAFEPQDDDFVPSEERWQDSAVPFSMSSREEREVYRRGIVLRDSVRTA